MAQIQNPYGQGSAALMMSAANMNPLKDAGAGLSGLSQSMNKYDLADMMAANGGNVNAGMNPLAMLTDKATQAQYNNAHDLLRTDRNLDLTEQNNLWGHEDRQAQTAMSGANSRRTAGTAANRLAYDKKSATDLLARQQTGRNQVSDYLTNVNSEQGMGPVEADGTLPPSVVNPLYPDRDGGNVSAPMATLLADEYQKGTANEYDIAKANAKAEKTAAATLFTKQIQGQIDMLKNKNTSETDQNQIAQNNSMISQLTQLGGTAGTTNTTVNPSSITEPIAVANKKIGLDTIKNSNLTSQGPALSYLDSNGNIDGIRGEIESDDYMGAQTSRDERDTQSKSALDVLKGKGYDTDWYSGPWNEQDQKWDRVESALATVIDKSAQSLFERESMEQLNKRYFSKIGMKVNKTDAGSNVFRTKDMDAVITARKEMATQESRIANVLVESEGIPYNQAVAEAKRLLADDKEYQAVKKRATKHGYPKSAFIAAQDLEAE